ncbi:MAG: AzlC family ABC transporter permease [Ahrensia sp.]|nr:AzlC family ABC transporter permease [Ahrensia sp.]
MLVRDETTGNTHKGVYDWSWFPRGMANLFSLPALILISAFIGFGGLAREADLPLGQLIFMVPAIWALPSHLVALGGIVAEASLFVIAPAVALAAIRMMPMVMALVPEIRAPGSKRWHMLLVCNMVAITAWVHTLQKAAEIPRPGRLPYFAGFASIMMVSTTAAAATVHQLAAGFPPIVMAGLYFLTPLYFAASIWNTARVLAEKLALIFGFALGPLFALLVPQASILLAGLIGGAGAFGVHLLLNRKPPA